MNLKVTATEYEIEDGVWIYTVYRLKEKWGMNRRKIGNPKIPPLTYNFTDKGWVNSLREEGNTAYFNTVEDVTLLIEEEQNV